MQRDSKRISQEMKFSDVDFLIHSLKHPNQKDTLTLTEAIQKAEEYFAKNGLPLSKDQDIGLIKAYRKAIKKVSKNFKYLSEEILFQLEEIDNIDTTESSPPSHKIANYYSDNIVKLLENDILSKTDVALRVLAFERWVAVLEHSFEKRDYQTAMAIVSGLNSVRIEKYTAMRGYLSKETEAKLHAISTTLQDINLHTLLIINAKKGIIPSFIHAKKYFTAESEAQSILKTNIKITESELGNTLPYKEQSTRKRKKTLRFLNPILIQQKKIQIAIISNNLEALRLANKIVNVEGINSHDSLLKDKYKLENELNNLLLYQAKDKAILELKRAYPALTSENRKQLISHHGNESFIKQLLNSIENLPVQDRDEIIKLISKLDKKLNKIEDTFKSKLTRQIARIHKSDKAFVYDLKTMTVPVKKAAENWKVEKEIDLSANISDSKQKCKVDLRNTRVAAKPSMVIPKKPAKKTAKKSIPPIKVEIGSDSAVNHILYLGSAKPRVDDLKQLNTALMGVNSAYGKIAGGLNNIFLSIKNLAKKPFEESAIHLRDLDTALVALGNYIDRSNDDNAEALMNSLNAFMTSIGREGFSLSEIKSFKGNPDLQLYDAQTNKISHIKLKMLLANMHSVIQEMLANKVSLNSHFQQDASLSGALTQSHSTMGSMGSTDSRHVMGSQSLNFSNDSHQLIMMSSEFEPPKRDLLKQSSIDAPATNKLAFFKQSSIEKPTPEALEMFQDQPSLGSSEFSTQKNTASAKQQKLSLFNNPTTSRDSTLSASSITSKVSVMSKASSSSDVSVIEKENTKRLISVFSKSAPSVTSKETSNTKEKQARLGKKT